MKKPHAQQTLLHAGYWEQAQVEADRYERAAAKLRLKAQRKKKFLERIANDPVLKKRIEEFDAKHGIDKERFNDPVGKVLRHHCGHSRKKVTLPKLELP